MAGTPYPKVEASRPNMPTEYGILDAKEGSGLLPGAWATERLASSRGTGSLPRGATVVHM